MKKVLVVWCTLLLMISCSNFRTTGLYEQSTLEADKPNINGFYQLAIYNDQITKEIWFTQNASCLNVNSQTDASHSGDGSIHIKWNKQAGGCPWLGLGIGWDNWTGKDLTLVNETAALSFWALSKDGDIKGLPWAVGFEDYGGSQTWTGCTSDLVVGGVITSNWTQVIIPLSKFNLLNSAVDPYTIKQLMFQFESSGEVLIDEISIIPLVNG